MDYYLQTGKILFDYYDIQEKIQQGISSGAASKKSKQGSILAILGDIAKQEASDAGEAPKIENRSALPETDKPLQRNELLNQYLSLIDPTMVQQNEVVTDDEWTLCELCGAEMSMCLNEAVLS